LHDLLEQVSAREFKDASVPIPIDASHVIWIATANYLMVALEYLEKVTTSIRKSERKRWLGYL
jgi:ATP-dependent Lon protease